MSKKLSALFTRFDTCHNSKTKIILSFLWLSLENLSHYWGQDIRIKIGSTLKLQAPQNSLQLFFPILLAHNMGWGLLDAESHVTLLTAMSISADMF